MTQRKLTIALPDGSLMDPDRGDLVGLMEDMNIGVRGYHFPKPSKYPTSKLYGTSLVTDRPQNMPFMLDTGVYDLAILGNDLMAENMGNAVPVLDLQTGKASVVAAIRPDGKYGRIIKLSDFLQRQIKDGEKVVIVTEYPVLATSKLQEPEFNDILEGKFPAVMIHGTKHVMINDASSHTHNPNVMIYYTYGNTEEVAKRISESRQFSGYEAVIVDNMQTGESIQNVGFRPLTEDPILETSAKLYAGRHVKDDKQLAEHAVELMTMLDGVVTARNNYDVKFNVSKDDIAQMIAYLKAEQLYAEEPTVVQPYNEGCMYQVNILVPSETITWNNTQQQLRRLGAESIIRTKPKQVLAHAGKDFERILREGITMDEPVAVA